MLETGSAPLLFKPLQSAADKLTALALSMSNMSIGVRFDGITEFTSWLSSAGRTKGYLVCVGNHVTAWYVVRRLNARASYASSAELCLKAPMPSNAATVGRIAMHAVSTARGLGYRQLVLAADEQTAAFVAPLVGRVQGRIEDLVVVQIDIEQPTVCG